MNTITTKNQPQIQRLTIKVKDLEEDCDRLRDRIRELRGKEPASLTSPVNHLKFP